MSLTLPLNRGLTRPLARPLIRGDVLDPDPSEPIFEEQRMLTLDIGGTQTALTLDINGQPTALTLKIE